MRTDGTILYGNFCATGEPECLDEALGDTRWLNAMQEEFDALQCNKTWHRVPSNMSSNLIDVALSGVYI